MLDMLLNSSDELLPASGFLGFLVHHWLAVAIVILVLGFALDQLFYVLLDRPAGPLAAAVPRAARVPDGALWRAGR